MASTSSAFTIHLSTWQPTHHEVFSQGALLYLLDGSGELWTTKHSISLQAKCAYLLPHHTSLTTQGASSLSVMICTWSSLEIISDHDQVISLNHSAIIAMMTLLVQETKQGMHHDEALKALDELLRITCLRYTHPKVQFQNIKTASRECETIHAYLTNHYQESITLDQLADLVHMNKYSLAHLYQRTTCHTIMEELKRIRLLHAKELLIHSEQSIQAIALSCGFSSSAYFIESFRRLYHITTLQYRKAQRRKKQ